MKKKKDPLDGVKGPEESSPTPPCGFTGTDDQGYYIWDGSFKWREVTVKGNSRWVKGLIKHEE